MTAVLFRDATVLTLDPADDHGCTPRALDIRVDGDRITALGPPGTLAADGATPFDAAGHLILPGFVQAHVHYCQTLFRGLADDLPLMRWLQTRIWPLEAAHDPASVRASAELSAAELLRGGTTTVQVMESIRHAEVTVDVARRSGMTTILGNCLMDVAGPGTPADWVTTTDAALQLCHDVHAAVTAAGPALHYAVSPRFILSCSDELTAAAVDFATTHDVRLHTHASEHPDEVALVRERTGTDYILALERQGLLTPRTTLAHCVHTTPAERDALQHHATAVAHCPSTNLKLGSGIAPIADYRDRGIRLALGADGAPCNNRLSALTEMRQAALLAATQTAPGTWPAAAALRTATIGGAEALGLADEVGSLRPGKRADLVLVAAPFLTDPVSHLVYAAETADIRHVMVGGTFAVRDGAVRVFDVPAIEAAAHAQLPQVLSRAGLAR